MMDVWLPRIFGGTGETRHRPFIRCDAQGRHGPDDVSRNHAQPRNGFEQQYGMPQPMSGFFLPPFDALADAMRGMTGALLDVFRQPDKVWPRAMSWLKKWPTWRSLRPTR